MTVDDEEADGDGDGEEGGRLGKAAGLSPEGGGAAGSLEGAGAGAEPLGAGAPGEGVDPSPDWASALEVARLRSHAVVKLSTELKRIMSLVGW